MSEQLGIIELGQVCVAMRARSLDLFTDLGGWVISSEPGELQRLFAEACHRHAWHADLWEARTPSIRVAFPMPAEHATLGADDADADTDEHRRDRYRAVLSSLDPSTARTIDLVGRDVVELAARIDALRTR